ncbi:MAG: hypothetical protein ACE5LC_03680 [Candidatus Aminicenantales bacterium]
MKERVEKALDKVKLRASLVFSLIEGTTSEDIRYVLDVFPPVVDRLRKMSPLYTEYLKERDR